MRAGILIALAALVAWAAPIMAQDTATLTGQVVDETTQRPLGGVQIFIVGSSRGTLTNQQGRFLIPNVPAGTYDVRASLIGYSQGTERVTLASGATATLSFSLAPSAIALDEVIVSATGELQRRRETGNVVSRISAEQIEPAAVNNLSQVLSARAPGVVVQQHTGTTGTSQRIRIRGANSISLSNQPLLIIDGVRVNNSSMGMNTINADAVWVGGQETTRWNDISPEEIENIEILKGPAAAALYGTAAANGVIQITTRRGRAGATRWSAYTETGSLRLDQTWPANFAQTGRTPAGGRVAACNLDAQAYGTCVPVADSLYSYNPLMADTPFRDGWRVNHGLNVSGGNEGLTYFLAGDVEREQGVLDPNRLRKLNLRANLSGAITENLIATVTTGYVRNRVTLPWNDNDAQGALGAGLLGSARWNETTGGYFSRHPSHFFFIDQGQDVHRWTTGLDLDWQPLAWLRIGAQAGLDQANTEDFQFAPSGMSNYSAVLVDGYRRVNRVQYSTISGNLAATATRTLRPDLQSTTSLGTAYYAEGQHGTFAYGRQMLVGTGTLGGAASNFAINETAQEIITIGAYARQQFGWRDRLFLSGTIRGDDNSAFGSDFEFVTYPGLSASWVVSEEDFFPRTQAISTVRLRSSYGQSGQRPGFRQASTYFSPVAVAIAGQEQTAITLGGSGNPTLRPERSTEVELGFDVGMFQDRLGLEVTYYDRTTRDALVARRLAPSLGAATTRFENIGRVSNRGIEAMINAQLVEGRNFGWNAALTASSNRNRLVEIGEGIEPIIFNSEGAQRHTEGYPLGSFFQRRIVSFADLNGDGLISRANCPDQPVLELADGTRPPCEIQLSDDAEYLGTPFPTIELGLNQTFTLFDWLRVGGQLDYKGGQKQYNYTKWFRCSNFQNCETAQNRDATPEDQANYIAGRFMGTTVGFIEDASFLKLREVSVTVMAPQRLMQRFGTQGLSLTLAGRNLATWTDYTGFDPEVNSLPYSGLGNFATQDFLTLPPVRTWTARLNVTF
jgi:TonB-dependent starch-binding outer membrane protein SusC